MGNNMLKPGCYGCKFRGNVPGDAHSQCLHPLVEAAKKEAFASIYSLFALAGGGVPMPVNGMIVKGNSHGIRNGWFTWPFNFDPVWLEECSGYDPKETPEASKNI